MLKNLLNKNLTEATQVDERGRLIEKKVFILSEKDLPEEEQKFEEVALSPEEERKKAEDAFFEIMLGKKVDRPLTFVEFLISQDQIHQRALQFLNHLEKQNYIGAGPSQTLHGTKGDEAQRSKTIAEMS